MAAGAISDTAASNGSGLDKPGVIPAIQRLLPGGESGQYADYTPGTHGAPVKMWFAGGVPFQLNADRTISVQRKNGTVKTYRPYRPKVLSKNPAKNTKLLIREMKKQKKLWSELNKHFGRRTCRK